MNTPTGPDPDSAGPNSPTPDPSLALVFGDPADPESVSTRYEVGEPWPGDPVFVAQPGAHWLADESLFLIVEDVVDERLLAEIVAPADIWILGYGPLVGLILRIGEDLEVESLMWRTPEQGVPAAISAPLPRIPIALVLAEASTGLVRHLRAFTLSPYASKTLRRECDDRWSVGVTPEQGAAAFAYYQERFPTIAAAKQGAFARSHAGD